jgi:hypothetical protein
MVNVRKRAGPIPVSPLVLAVWLALVLLAFGLAYALGYATAGTRSALRSASQLPSERPEVELTGLFRAEALPPLTHDREHHAAGTPVPIERESIPGRAVRPPAGSLAVPPFTLHYHVRAIASSVQFVEVSLSGLEGRPTVELRCLRLCTLSERLALRPGGRATSSRLRGWLRRGALVELRARRPGWIGAHATIVVTGLPRAIAVERACLPATGAQIPVPCDSLGRR